MEIILVGITFLIIVGRKYIYSHRQRVKNEQEIEDVLRKIREGKL